MSSELDGDGVGFSVQTMASAFTERAYVAPGIATGGRCSTGTSTADADSFNTNTVGRRPRDPPNP